MNRAACFVAGFALAAVSVVGASPPATTTTTGTGVWIRLPDRLGQERWRPAAVIEAVGGKLLLEPHFSKRLDRDVYARLGTRTERLSTPGTAVGQWRKAPPANVQVELDKG